MHAERFARIKRLFDEVLDLSGPERDEYLQALAGDDPTLIADVRSLLERTSGGDTVLARPVHRLLDSLASGQPGSGDTLGVWTLGEEIGRGGMGTVFRADRSDGQFEQTAAIKLLRGVASSQALEHLARERQILAALSHPNIARLFDGGATPGGQPYLVMEYVDGVPIDRYCAEQGLSRKAIIELFVAICGAVGFAHRHLVVHCDLKPSNMLVSRDGHPVLLDFGIAHRLAGAAASPEPGAAGPHGFTPGYASPEQKQGGPVTAATDVYGLGRVLADLLAPPESGGHAGADAARLPTSLAAIVRRATADEPDRRYASAHELADDLKRHLDGRPVLAVDGGRLYRLRCHLRRHALAFGLGALAVLALLAGLFGTTASLLRARSERERAEVAAARATRTADFLGDLLAGVDPDRARDLDKTLLRELLDQAAVKAQSELAAEPEVLSQIERVIGHTYTQLTEYATGVVHLKRALALLPADRVRERLNLREAIVDAQAPTLDAAATLHESEALHHERLAAFGPDDPDTLKSAVQVGWQHAMNGDYRRAAEESAELEPRLERQLGIDAPTTLDNLRTLAVSRSESGEYDEAEAVLKVLVERHLRVYGEVHTRTLAAQSSLAVHYMRRQRFGDAEVLLRKLHEAALRRYGPKHYMTINLAGQLGSALRQGGKLAESEPYYRGAYEGARDLYGESNAATLAYALNYANYEVAGGDASGALRRLDRIGPAMGAAFGEEHPNLAEWQRTRARALALLKRTGEARAAWQRALEIDRHVFGSDDHPQVLEDRAGLKALP